MRTWRCTDTATLDDEPCGCEYRSPAPGVMQYRYVGDQQPWADRDADWTPIAETSVAAIEALGHRLTATPDP